MGMTTACSNWSDLPGDLQALFMRKLVSYRDYIRFGAVCKSWHSILAEFLDPKQVPPHLPFLMIPSSSPLSSIDNLVLDDTEETRSLYCIRRKKVYDDLKIQLPYNKYCRGSSHGWLVVVEEDEAFSVRLYSPFLSFNNEIQLPPLTALEMDTNDTQVSDHKFIDKAIISVDPASNPKDYVVMMIYGGRLRLAFCRPGDKTWTSLPFEMKGFCDVIYHKGMFYAITYNGGKVVECDLRGSELKFRTIAEPSLNYFGGGKMYIVKSLGDLLQVRRDRTYTDDDVHSTISFRIFKLLIEMDIYQYSVWTEVNTLWDQMLLLGDNTSISLKASDYPGCKPNCIYFTDDYHDAEVFLSNDVGVFDLEDRSVHQHYSSLPLNTSIWPTPIWVVPETRFIDIVFVNKENTLSPDVQHGDGTRPDVSAYPVFNSFALSIAPIC